MQGSCETLLIAFNNAKNSINNETNVDIVALTINILLIKYSSKVMQQLEEILVSKLTLSNNVGRTVFVINITARRLVSLSELVIAQRWISLFRSSRLRGCSFWWSKEKILWETQFLFLTRGKRKISYFKYDIYGKKRGLYRWQFFLTKKADNVGLFELTRSTSSTLLTVLK